MRLLLIPEYEDVTAKFIICWKAKSRTQPHGLYTPLPIPNEPWVDIIST